MTVRFKRGYYERGWWNSIENRWIDDEWAIRITKVTQNDEYGKLEDIDEDEIETYGGFKTMDDAIDELNRRKVTQIIRI